MTAVAVKVGDKVSEGALIVTVAAAGAAGAAGACSAAALATESYDREHVTPYIYRNPDRFRCADLVQPTDESRLRWTVDTPEDFAFVERVYAALYPRKPDFTSDDVRALPFAHFGPEAGA